MATSAKSLHTADASTARTARIFPAADTASVVKILPCKPINSSMCLPDGRPRVEHVFTHGACVDSTSRLSSPSTSGSLRPCAASHRDVILHRDAPRKTTLALDDAHRSQSLPLAGLHETPGVLARRVRSSPRLRAARSRVFASTRRTTRATNANTRETCTTTNAMVRRARGRRATRDGSSAGLRESAWRRQLHTPIARAKPATRRKISQFLKALSELRREVGRDVVGQRIVTALERARHR